MHARAKLWICTEFETSKTRSSQGQILLNGPDYRVEASSALWFFFPPFHHHPTGVK
jgi:hypothetical protein